MDHGPYGPALNGPAPIWAFPWGWHVRGQRCELGGHFFLAFRHDCPTRHLRLSALADSLSDDDDDDEDDE